jgi:RNA polymerase sigma factor (sigma-70 family)
MDHMAAIEACVSRFVATKRAPIERDELAGVARVAYTRAMATYRPDTGSKFSTWAWQLMWYAMIEELRRLDPQSRSERAAIKRGEEVQLITIGELREDMYGSHDIAPSVCARLDLIAALRSLPHRIASILLWRAFGYSQEEIARDQRCTASRICQLETEGRRRIARFA